MEGLRRLIYIAFGQHVNPGLREGFTVERWIIPFFPALYRHVNKKSNDTATGFRFKPGIIRNIDGHRRL